MATSAEAQPSSSSLSLGARERAARFCRRFGLRVPILQAPMAGACPTSLASAVANAGGMGGLGTLTTPPDGIADWVREFRGQSNGGLEIDLWIPDPPPVRDPRSLCISKYPMAAGFRDQIVKLGPSCVDEARTGGHPAW